MILTSPPLQTWPQQQFFYSYFSSFFLFFEWFWPFLLCRPDPTNSQLRARNASVLSAIPRALGVVWIIMVVKVMIVCIVYVHWWEEGYIVVHPWRPRDFPRPERFSQGLRTKRHLLGWGKSWGCRGCTTHNPMKSQLEAVHGQVRLPNLPHKSGGEPDYVRTNSYLCPILDLPLRRTVLHPANLLPGWAVDSI